MLERSDNLRSVFGNPVDFMIDERDDGIVIQIGHVGGDRSVVISLEYMVKLCNEFLSQVEKQEAYRWKNRSVIR